MFFRAGKGWSFESELVLETFIWENLELFSLTPLKRQYYCKGEICDIVAVGQNQELVILEIKNTEDRYVVQQLTRYYDNLSQDRPCADKIDYSKPVRLIAIAPAFHRHNFVDQKYSRLDIEFFAIEVQQGENEFCVEFKSLQSQQVLAFNLPYTPVEFSSEDLPDPPERLLDALRFLPADVQRKILRTRQQILRFDPRIQELVTTESIGYGRSQKKLCAEFCFDRKQRELVLFLWIPLWRHQRMAIGRHRIWTDWQTISAIAHIPTGLGKAKPMSEWDQTPIEKWPRKHLYSGKAKLIADDFSQAIATSMGSPKRTKSLAAIVDIALKHWQERQ